MEQQILKKNNRPSRKTMIFIYFYIILLLLLLFTAATYTWFSLSKTPRVSNIAMYVTARSGMELALEPDSEEWGNQLSYLDMVGDTAPLRPITWSEKDQIFYAAVYNADGRLTGNWQPLSDAVNANRNNYEGYYCLGTFYARTSESVQVSLTSAVDIEEGITGSGTYLIGSPIWNSETVSHHNAGQGAENAVRIGIKITDLDEKNQPIEDNSIFYIYEPNCDTHINGTTGYVNTPSIDGTATLVPTDRLITQTHTSWTETDPVEKGEQIYTFGEFTSKPNLFRLKAGSKLRIQIYIWLEGQDMDCTNAIKEAQILANIQFLAQGDSQSGMTPIE